MGTDIHGYVEINNINIIDEISWYLTIDIGLLGERNYDLFSRLFGVRVEENLNIDILAPNRGIPKNSSQEKYYFNDTCMHSATWVHWKELKDFLDTIEIEPLLKGWIFIFDSMASLSNIYADENVRLIVVFDN